MPNILILGGSTEASALADAVAERAIEATLSYAGRTRHPRPQPLPTRIGGFGGVDGLSTYLRDRRITHLVDATHPFAARISANAAEAASRTGVPLIALCRPPWRPVAGDRWTPVPDIAACVTALAGPPRRIMLALGRMHVAAFAAQPQHFYLLRFVDRPAETPILPRHAIVVDRGPFTEEADAGLLAAHDIDLVVCKNAGGSGARSKLLAARALGLPVTMIDRPAMPDRREVYGTGDVLAWIAHAEDRGV